MTQIDWCQKYWKFGSLVEAFQAQQSQGSAQPVLHETFNDARRLFLELTGGSVFAPQNVSLADIVSDMYHLTGRALALEICH